MYKKTEPLNVRSKPLNGDLMPFEWKYNKRKNNL